MNIPELQCVLARHGRFKLGQIVMTANAHATLDHGIVHDCLARHSQGDWGDLDPEDRAENELSLREGFRLFSVYHDLGEKFYIITEADRSSTCVLLPEDY